MEQQKDETERRDQSEVLGMLDQHRTGRAGTEKYPGGHERRHRGETQPARAPRQQAGY